jgi:hypothetical protein
MNSADREDVSSSRRAPFGRAEIMGAPDKPGHDDQKKGVKAGIHLDAG